MNTRFLLILWCLAGSAQAELIPADRKIDWSANTRTGVIGGIPTNRTNLVDVTRAPYNADKSGVTDARAAIQDAINNAKPQDVVYLPAGTYRIASGSLSAGLNRDNITVRGAGMDATTIKLDNGAGGTIAFSMGSGLGTNWEWPPPNERNVTGGLTQGSKSLTVQSAANYTIGALVLIGFSNRVDKPSIQAGKVPIGVGTQWNIDNSTGLMRQVARITAKQGNTLSFAPEIYADVSGLTAKVFTDQGLQLEGFGLEDLTIDSSKGVNGFGVALGGGINCWVKNVKSKAPGNYPFFFVDCLNVEARHNYADGLRGTGGGSNGAGFLINTVSASLFEDNIVKSVFPLWEINHGSSGNVIAYNFSIDAVSGMAYDINHGPHNVFNLYEGNIGTSIKSDGYFGGSSEDTVFRNWFHGDEGYTTSFNRFTRRTNFIGNRLGREGGPTVGNSSTDFVTYGLPNIGNSSSSGEAKPTAGDFWTDFNQAILPNGYQELDLDVKVSAIEKANYAQGWGYIAGTVGGDTLPPSLFRSSKPAWFGNLAWPPFDPKTGVASDERIPAGYRYVHGNDPGGGGGPTPTPGPSATPTPGPTPPAPSVSFALQWNAVPTATEYFVYENNTKIAEQTTLTYSLTGKIGPKSYTVSAVNAAGESPRSNTVNLPAPTPTPAPTATPTPTPRPPAAPVLEIIQQP